MIQAFDAGALDPAAFHHVDHVKLTWALLRRLPLEAAIDRIRAGLIRLATSVGRAERYHETITVFYALQIHERMSQAETWPDFAQRNPDLIEYPKAFLGRYYSETLLSADLARKNYVPPDLVDPSQ